MNVAPFSHAKVTRPIARGACETAWLRRRLVAAAVPAVVALLSAAAITMGAFEPDSCIASATPSAPHSQLHADAVEVRCPDNVNGE